MKLKNLSRPKISNIDLLIVLFICLKVSTILAFNYSERLVRVFTCSKRPTDSVTRKAYDTQFKNIKEAGKKWFKQNVPDEVIV
jgi:hypothetical protein